MYFLHLGTPISPKTLMKSKIPFLACTAALVLASSSFTQAASVTVDTVGTMNNGSNNITPLEATGNSFTATTFASNVATAYTNDTGGVWNFETAFNVNNGETITLNYGASLAKSVVLTLSGNSINQGSGAGIFAQEPTSGVAVMGFATDGSTRTFALSVPLLSIGIFNTDRNSSDRFPVLTVTFQDNTTASTSGANADNTYFHGITGTALNPIVSFSLSQNNFVRYDDLGFIVAPSAIPEPSTYAIAAGGLVLVGAVVASRRRANAAKA